MKLQLTFVALLTFIFINLNANLAVGIITDTAYCGDREVAWRIRIAAERLGWEVYLDEQRGQKIKEYELDFVINLLPDCEISIPSCPNYLMVFHPFNYLENSRQLKPQYANFDGYLLTINDRDILSEEQKKQNKTLHYVPFYPTVYDVAYKQLDLNNLVVMVPVWGDRLTEPRFRNLYHLLSQTGQTKFYGLYPHQDMLTKGYMGSIPFDGASVIDILQKHGIVLVFHSYIHNGEGIPSSRIFEAAAASMVIISDQNPFVKNNFGDSVFYIDTNLPGDEIFQQVQAHLDTIAQDPEKALQMAEKAHQIFIDKFTMEDQLLQLEKMHRKVVSQKSN